MTLNDRLTIGLIAGLAGGVAMNVVDLASFALGVTELRYLDWAAIVTLGVKPANPAETVFALGTQIIAVGILGIVFAYLIGAVSSRNHLLRGWLFGIVVWFALYGITLLFHIQQTIPVRLDTALSNLAGASVYGLVMAGVLGWLERRVIA